MVPFERAFDPTHQLETYGCRYDALALACGSQMGKSDAVLDIMGWTLDQRPAPVLYVGPNKEYLNKEIEPRLMDVLKGAPRLRERLAAGKRMTLYRKIVGGVPIALGWAGSAASFAAMAAKTALIDELDRMKSSVQGEGDPFTLLEARGFSYADRIRAAISTPLIGTVDVERDAESGLEFWKKMQPEDVESPIWRLFQSGTMHHWAWPCPHCEEYFIPRFRQLVIPDGATPAKAKRESYLLCPGADCGGVIEDHHKAEMNRRGVYVAPGQTVSKDGEVSGDAPDTTTLSFWVSGLCSPFVTFGERAASYVVAKLSGESDKVQGVINTGFGELYAPGAGDAPEWTKVKELASPRYSKGQLPIGARMLTLAVDVQKNRLVYTIRAWGAFGSSWLVDFGELYGMTTDAEVWNDLALLLTTPIGGMSIWKCFIDSGFRPGKPINLPVNKVYEFARRFPRLVYPTKGRRTQDKPLILSKNDVNAKGDVKKYGLDLIWLDTDYCKSWVHERVLWEPDKPGAWLLPGDVTDDYCKQIVSEARVKKANGQAEWLPLSRNNHFLDCEGMQAGLAHLLNVHMLRPLENETPAPDAPIATGRPARPGRRSPPPAAARPTEPPKTPPAAVAPAAAANIGLNALQRRTERRSKIAEVRARIYGS